MTNEFMHLHLQPQLVQAVTELGYTTPTPIQASVIPVMLTHQDIIGQAPTGTGKTAAFSLPLLQKLTPEQSTVQGLIVTPTRELAMQVAQAIYQYGRYQAVRVLAIYGGQPYGRQINRLKKGVDIVVGTPGRLLDLIQQKALDLSLVHTVILDEADEMLSMGFIEDIEAILSHTPDNRQTALFSATLPPEIRQLADKYMCDPHSIAVKAQQQAAAAIEQRRYLVPAHDKLAALTRLFEVEAISSALIFTRTRVGTGELANELSVRGFPAEALNGDLNQNAREQVLNRFRQQQIKVLVATDVAARGLDIDDISHVFNYDLPRDPEAYVHRIGRTGRAGKTGIAISLMTPNEQWHWRKIERYTKQQIAPSSLPTIADIQAHRETQLLNQMNVWLQRDRCSREKEMVAQLVDSGHDLMAIAAAALKLARVQEKQRPIAPITDIKDAPSSKRRSRTQGRGQEKGMVRLTLNAGKIHGIRPNDIVGTIAYHANIPGYTIGAIRIQKQHTLVDVPQQFVTQVLDKSGRYQIRKKAITVERS